MKNVHIISTFIHTEMGEELKKIVLLLLLCVCYLFICAYITIFSMLTPGQAPTLLRQPYGPLMLVFSCACGCLPAFAVPRGRHSPRMVLHWPFGSWSSYQSALHRRSRRKGCNPCRDQRSFRGEPARGKKDMIWWIVLYGGKQTRITKNIRTFPFTNVPIIKIIPPVIANVVATISAFRTCMLINYSQIRTLVPSCLMIIPPAGTGWPP